MTTTSELERQQDAEASYFAICLLMPRTLVNSELDKLLSIDPNMDADEIVQLLARKFAVGHVAMTMRLVELGRLHTP